MYRTVFDETKITGPITSALVRVERHGGCGMDLTFEGEVIEWRGPAPFHFVAVPLDVAETIRDVAAMVTYGWGVIPVTARSGGTSWTTSLFPRDGGYLVPVKDVVRRAEHIDLGDMIEITLSLDLSRGPGPGPRPRR